MNNFVRDNKPFYKKYKATKDQQEQETRKNFRLTSITEAATGGAL